MKIRWGQVLAWRMRRQLLDPRGAWGAAEVAATLCGVQAQVPSSAQLAIAARQADPEPDAVERALRQRSLMKTWAMRGTLHLLAPEAAGAYLALLADLRSWEKPAWQRSFGVGSADMTALVRAAGDALDGRVLSRPQLVEELIVRTGRRHLEEQLRSGWGAVLKPLGWMGHLCNGPTEGGRVTFTRPDTWLPTWGGLPEPQEAARAAIAGYLRAYGPARIDAFDRWLTRGRAGNKRLLRWLSTLQDDLVEVDVEGESAYLLAVDLEELRATRPAPPLRLLPGFDQYILGPGTGDTRIITGERRAQISKAGGWISPVVIAAGRVAGVWRIDEDSLTAKLFGEAGVVPQEPLRAESERIASFLGRRLRVVVETV